jgi:threonine dehydratase
VGESTTRKHGQAETSLDFVVAPVGGVGMLSGVPTTIKGIDIRIIVIGAEPQGV